jgi:D-glycerate 3-kinase
MTGGIIVDDKSEHCITFLLERIDEHKKRSLPEKAPPFFLGINGIQGAGKTTLVNFLERPHYSSSGF